MLQTLFYIPAEIAGVPLFGWGLLVWLWLAWTAVYAVLRGRRFGWDADLASSIGMMLLVAGALIYLAPHLVEHDEDGRSLGIAIRGYGVMLLAGITSGVGLAVYRGRRVGISSEVIFSLALWVFVGGMLGARAFYVIEYWSHFQRPTLGETIGAVVNMTRGGLVVFGGLLGALPALVLFARKHKLTLLPLADLVAPSMTIGLALGRVGCFFNGCCFGDVCELPWSVQFPAMSPPHVRQIEQGRAFGFTLGADRKIVAVEPGSPAEKAGLQVGNVVQAVDGRDVATSDEAREAIFFAFRERHLPLRLQTDAGLRSMAPLPGLMEHSRPTHPAQLYAALDGLLLTLLLLAFDPLKRREGETFALLLSVHAVSRFLLEIVRIDEPSVFGTGLSISQNISVAMLATGVGLFIYLERRPAGPMKRAQPATA